MRGMGRAEGRQRAVTVVAGAWGGLALRRTRDSAPGTQSPTPTPPSHDLAPLPITRPKNNSKNAKRGPR